TERVDLFVLDLREVHGAGHVAGVNIKPVDTPLALVGFLHRRVKDADGTRRDSGGAANVAADAVAAQQTDNRIVGDMPSRGVDVDPAAVTGRRELLVARGRHRGDSSNRKRDRYGLAARKA